MILKIRLKIKVLDTCPLWPFLNASTALVVEDKCLGLEMKLYRELKYSIGGGLIHILEHTTCGMYILNSAGLKC